jgi:hypothetical protein
MKVCKQCNSSFLSWTRIDGKVKNLGSRKFCLECSPYGAHNTKANLTPMPLITIRTCPKCNASKALIEFYNRRSKPGTSVYCKLCTNAQTVIRQRDLKVLAVEYKGGKCSNCTYNKYIGALEFHHLDPAQKDLTLSNHKCASFDTIKPELDKCILLCSNCHREEHYRLRNLLSS